MKVLSLNDVQHIQVYDTKQDASRAVASLIVEQIHLNSRSVMTLATGATMEPVYASITALIREDEVDVSQLQLFHLDEYWPCHPSESYSFIRYLRHHVFEPWQIRPDQQHLINGAAENGETEASRYEAELSQYSVDLVLLGIGPGGHIGFNERGAAFSSRTHLQQLSPETVYRDQVERKQDSPPTAITQGVANIIAGRQLLLVAFGGEKGRILAEALSGPVTEECPASILQAVQEKVTFMLDQAAAEVLVNESQAQVKKF